MRHLEHYTEVHAEMGQELVGVASSLIAHRDCPGELLYSITATAGVPFRNEGPPLSIEEREFAVICPVSGITVSEVAKFDGVELDSVSSTLDRISTSFDVPDEFRRWLQKFPAIARVAVSAARMHDAQGLGVGRIHEVLGKLVVISRYSLLVAPDAELWTWARDHKFFNPQRANVAIVINEAGTGSWIQRLEVTPYDRTLDVQLPPLVQFQNDAAQPASLGKRQAMVFLARAARRLSVIDRVISMWQAIEFFVGDYSVPPTFDNPAKKAIKAARKELAKSLTAEQSLRLIEVLGNLNNPSLRMNLDHYIASAGIPISRLENDLIWSLRYYRNDVIQGRDADPPKQEVIDRGIAVAARLFLWPREAN